MPNYNKIYLILATVISANIYFGFLPKIAVLILGTALLILAALAYSQKRDGKITAGGLALSAVAFLTLLALLSVPFFYISHLGKFFAILCLIIIFAKTKNSVLTIPSFRHTTYYMPHAAYFVLAACLFYPLIKSASGGTIASPWLLLPAYFLPLFFLATALLIFLLRKKNHPALLAAHFFLFFCVAAFIYKFGCGFDQFIHEAAQKYIASHGSISPKSIQYIGLYGINIFLHYTTGLSFAALNAFLLPALSALIPPLAYHSVIASHSYGVAISSPDEIASPAFAGAGLQAPRNDNQKTALSILAILLLPLSYFIVTTPQGLANLLLLILIFLSLNSYKKRRLPLAIFFIHPITGIIALIYTGLIHLKFKKIIAITGIFALPAAFTLLSFKSGGGLHINFNLAGAIKEYSSLLTFGAFKQNYNLWLDLIYLIQYLMLPAIIIVSVYVAWRYRKKISRYPLYLFGITTASFFATAIFADFSYLIGYEQKNYPERLFYISFLFLTPYLILAVEKMASLLPLSKGELEGVGAKGSWVLKIFFALLFAFTITANFYLTYPRWDNYQNDKGKNVTAEMMRAVELIKNDSLLSSPTPAGHIRGSNDRNYVVLTDQAVSAAALKLDGFKKYYSTPLGEIFYYPIPTGGPLYNEFLNLVYNNTGARSAQNAKLLTGAEAAYIILPSYWENYNKIKENLKTEMRVIFEDKNIVILR